MTGQLQAGLPYQGHAATATKRQEDLCTDCSPVLLLTCVLYPCADIDKTGEGHCTFTGQLLRQSAVVLPCDVFNQRSLVK